MLKGIESSVLPSKRLAELPVVAIGDVSVIAFAQMPNPEKQHLAKPRSQFDSHNNTPLRGQRPLLGQSGHKAGTKRCPLLKVKRV